MNILYKRILECVLVLQAQKKHMIIILIGDKVHLVRLSLDRKNTDYLNAN